MFSFLFRGVTFVTLPYQTQPMNETITVNERCVAIHGVVKLGNAKESAIFGLTASKVVSYPS